ncbi:MAG: AMP-binding protein, partial [Acidimicrobiia bacterium]
HEQHSGPATALADGLGLDRPARLALGPIRGFTDLGTVLASHPDTTPVGRRTGSVLHLGSEPAAPPVAPRPALGPDEAAGRLTQVLDAFGIPSGREQVHLCTVAPHVPSWVTFAGAALHAGHRVVFSRPGDVAGLLRSIERYRCTYTHLEPDLLEALRVVAPDRRGRHDLSSMRWAVHPAEGCGSEAKQALRSWWGPVVREYRTLALDAAGAPGEATDRSVGPVGGGGALHLCPA